MTASVAVFPVRPEHVAALAESVLQKTRGAAAVGLHAPGPWTGGESVLIGGLAHPVAWCASELAVREALDRYADAGGPPPIVLTPLDELGWDVRARLAKQRLLPMEPWTLVAELFHTGAVDPRITRHPWIAEVLLEAAPAGGYAPLPGAVLDADTAWQHVLARTLGLRTARPDADALLEASADPAAAARYAQLPERARQPLAERMEEGAGRLGALLANAMETGRAGALVALGLACEVVYPEGDAGGAELARAAARLELYAGGEAIDPRLGRRWAQSALRVLDRLPDPQVARVHQQAESILRDDLNAELLLGHSTALPASYERRLEAFGRAVAAFLAGGGAAQVDAALDRVVEHRQARAPAEAERGRRLRMAVRLVRFLASRGSGAPAAFHTLSDAARAYAAEGSWVDWARTVLTGGEQEGSLAAALEGLAGAVRIVREDENRRFAERLAEWHGSPGREPAVIPIDRVLDEVVAPAAEAGPVLLLVLDGMGFASFRQLCGSLAQAGWQEWLSPDREARTVALAAAPSITRVSRTSLFAGRLLAGAAADERREFARHAGLVGRSKPRRLPRLFHKGDLTEGASAGLAEPVRQALGDTDQQVVGIVLNVLDDSLAKSDQALPSWTTGRIRLLEPILFEARVAGRLLVLASDHGHVLDAGTVALPGGDEERWRPFAEPLAAEETVLAGPRIQAGAGVERIVVPWSERVRYVRRKAGYHGGASPQEMLLPVAVLAPWDRQVEGWTAAAERPPRWWDPAEAPAVPAAAPPPEPPQRKKPRPPAAQPSLFGDPAEAAPAPPPQDWITRLLASDAFAGQRAIAGRAAPGDDVVRAFLEVLDQGHGRVPRALLVRALGVPEIRVRGLLAGLQRLLNLDGYPVVASDEATGTVDLNRDLLRTQFALEERR
jgi:hypothetical protein